MEYRMRRYESEEDYWKLREFLRKVFTDNGLREYSWHVARLYYWRLHVMKNCLKVYSLNEHNIFWEDGNKKIVAAVNCEGFGEVHSQVHPFLTAKSWKKRCLKSRRSTFLARMTESRGSGCSPILRTEEG
ncbi:hypothetical protein EU77_12525 [Mesotoga sp. SC_NapDC]|nr:hypothetical protein EU77_12525 [Mesotoga sp. SC_NapDC]